MYYLHSHDPQKWAPTAAAGRMHPCGRLSTSASSRLLELPKRLLELARRLLEFPKRLLELPRRLLELSRRLLGLSRRLLEPPSLPNRSSLEHSTPQGAYRRPRAPIDVYCF